MQFFFFFFCKRINCRSSFLPSEPHELCEKSSGTARGEESSLTLRVETTTVACSQVKFRGDACSPKWKSEQQQQQQRAGIPALCEKERKIERKKGRSRVTAHMAWRTKPRILGGRRSIRPSSETQRNQLGGMKRSS